MGQTSGFFRGLRTRSRTLAAVPAEEDSVAIRERAATQEVALEEGDKALFLVQALYAYAPPDGPDSDQDLRFAKDDQIEVLADEVEDLGEGWMLGRLSGRAGFFPANYVQRMRELEPPAEIVLPSASSLLYLAEALYSYAPPDEEDHEADLRFTKGDLIEVVKEDVEELGEVTQPHPVA